MRIVMFALAMVAMLSGCESTPHYNRTKLVMLGAAYEKKPYGTVQLFQSKSDVGRPYDVTAIMSVAGNAGDEAAFIKAFLYRAADIGADGIIFYRGNQMGGTSGGGWIAGKYGAFGMPMGSEIDGAYQGEAIHFK